MHFFTETQFSLDCKIIREKQERIPKMHILLQHVNEDVHNRTKQPP